MYYLPISFLAGILTGLAPCILPILPIVLSGSAGTKNNRRLQVIVGSLAVSIVVFSLLLRQTTRVLGISDSNLSLISGLIILAVGVFTLSPQIWERLMVRMNLRAQKNLKASHSSLRLAAITGLSLGPIFISCSPTYGLIISTILPESFGTGVINLVSYALGLSLFLWLIGSFGQKMVSKLNWAVKPDGWFRHALALVFVFVGISIILGWDKTAEAWLLDNFAPYQRVINLEQKLIN